MARPSRRGGPVEVTEADWDQFYASGRIPWATGGLSELTRSAVARYREGPDLLEVGCGTGQDLKDLVELGFRVHGIDISKRAASAASARVSDAVVEAADFFQWNPPRLFDVVYDRGVYHNLGTPSLRGKFAKQVSGALAKGGIWITVAAAADGQRSTSSHGGVFLQDLVVPIEPFFEFLEVKKDSYGLVGPAQDLPAWHCVLARR